MANTVFTYGMSGIAGAINLASDTLKAALLMSNNDAAATEDAQFLSGLTLDECDGAGYARLTVTATLTASTGGANAAKLDIADLTFPLVGASTRAIVGILFYKHVGADTGNIPILYIDTAPGFPLTPNGADINVVIAAGGLLTLG